MLSPDILDRGRGTFEVIDRLEAKFLEQVQAQGEEVQLLDGTCLFRAGDRCEGFGFVLDGTVKVSVLSESGREMVLYRVRPGETCTVTVSCLVNDTPYPANGTVEGPLDAISIPRSLFNDLVDGSRVFRQFVLEIFSAKVNHLMVLINEVAFNKLHQRLGARLLELGPVVTMTHQELAGELGTSREIVSRLLQNFADEGLVTLGRKRIAIEDSSRFEELANGP
jgi:CRP/FNR family transcriptional regulator